MIALERRVAALPRGARLAAAAAAGAATALGQAPVGWPAVLFLALPLLWWLLEGAAGPRAGFGIGWAAGVGFFAAALFWIVDPFLVQPEIYGWMAPFALVGVACGLALFWAVPFALARAWPPGLGRMLALAALWSLSDYARSHLLTGFPWALPAYVWVETPVIQTAALFGPHLLGLLTLVAALLPGLGSWRALGAAAALVAAGWGFGAWRLSQPVPERPVPLVVRLVQPNAVQAEKWLPGKAQEFYDRHIAMTLAPGDPRPGVTIWSETAVPFALGDAPELQAESAAAAGPDGRLILGITRHEPTPEGERWFNSLAVLDPDGTAAAVYDKYHLVPFGEYVPLARLDRPAGAAGPADPDRGRLHRGFRAAPGERAGPAAVPAADLLRGDLSRRDAGARGPGGVAGAGDQRRLVRRGFRPLPALRPGPGARDRAGPAAGPRRQYRDLGDGRSLWSGARQRRSRPSGLRRCGASGPAAAYNLCAFRRYTRFDCRHCTFRINCFNFLRWHFSKVASIT